MSTRPLRTPVGVPPPSGAGTSSRPWRAVPDGPDRGVDVVATLPGRTRAARCHATQVGYQFDGDGEVAATLRRIAADEGSRLGAGCAVGVGDGLTTRYEKFEARSAQRAADREFVDAVHGEPVIEHGLPDHAEAMASHRLACAVARSARSGHPVRM